MSPATSAALHRMSAALAAAPALTVRLTSLREVARPGSQQQVMQGATIAVGMRRPARLAALVGSDRGSFRLWFDGSTATLLSLTANVYAQSVMPRSDVDAFLAMLEQRLGVEVPLRDLLAADPFDALTEASTSGEFIGRTVVNGALCDQYALSNRDVDWQIWIAVGDKPLPCRLAVVDRALAGAPRTILEFLNWDLSARLDDATFDFVAPKGARQIPWLEQAWQPRPAADAKP